VADVALALLWHQHQPYYPDDVAGQNAMPWVRLHGVKDYYGMALHLLEFPELRCTINLVPSLLQQLQAYTEHGASDRFLDLTRIPADGLQEGDCLFLLDHFFMANPEQMIQPFPRYGELYQRRAFGAEDVVKSAMALRGYGVGLLGLIGVKILAPGFYARQDIRTPVTIASYFAKSPRSRSVSVNNVTSYPICLNPSATSSPDPMT